MLAPWSLVSVAPIAIGSQLVGLKTNPGRSIVTLTTFNCNGMPSSTVGSGSLVTVKAAVCGSTLICARTTTVPWPVVPERV